MATSLESIQAKIDADLKAKKAELDALTSLRDQVASAIKLGTQNKLPDEAILGIVTAMYERAVPAAQSGKKGKGGRPKGSVNKTKNIGGRGKRISKAKISKIQKLHKDGLSNNAIAKAVGTTPKTVANYVK